MKSKLITLFFTVLYVITLITGCTSNTPEESATNEISTDEHQTKQTNTIDILLSDEIITVSDNEISADITADVYRANDIIFYLEGQDFTYGEGTPEEEHSQKEADAHTVVHITKPGTYRLSGKLSAGQIAVDLGENAEENPESLVTLILDNVDITCTVAPAVIFYNVYECSSSEEEDASYAVDTTSAGANIIIADGSQNNITGSHVARIYKSVELNEEGTEVIDSEKLHKYDAAFYSKMTMNIYGETKNTGILNITADNEGLDSELHLTIHGGNINITSGNDGINTNEDGVSVTTINGGNVNINVTGSTGEGDGIDSNGWLVINGGSVTASACGFSGDAGIDSDMGIYLNGGKVTATGNMLDAITGTKQNYAVFQFETSQKGGNTYTLKNESGNVISEWTPTNDFMYMIVSGPKLTEGTYTFWCGKTQISGYAMMNGMMDIGPSRQMREDGPRPEMPEGTERPEGEPPEKPDDRQMWDNTNKASTEFKIIAGENQFFCQF